MTEECLKALRKQILIIMAKKNWTLIRLAIECEISLRELKAILYNEKKDIKLSTLARISEGLNKPISFLIYSEKQMQGKP